MADIDADQLAQDLSNAREDVTAAKDDEEREHAVALVAKYEAMQAVVAH